MKSSVFLIILIAATFHGNLIGAPQSGSVSESADPYFQPGGSQTKVIETSEQQRATQSSDKVNEQIQLTTHLEEEADEQRRPITGAAFEPSRVLARVGGHAIFVSDLSVEVMQLVDRHIPSAPIEVKQREAKNLLPRVLPKYVQAKLLFVDVLDSMPEGANINDIFQTAGSQFDEGMLPQLIKNHEVKSATELDAYYRALGSSLRKVKQSWIESELVKFMLRNKIDIDPEVSHREMYEYYLNHREDYSIKAKVHWEQLMIRFDKFPNREAAHAAISELGNEVVYGAPLPAVAKRSSHGFKASEGGNQGWTTKGSLVDKNLDNILFTIEPGRLSEIIETRRGYVILRVIDRQEAGFVTFEETQSEIRDKLAAEKQEQSFADHVEAIKKRIPVEIFDPSFTAELEGSSHKR